MTAQTAEPRSESMTACISNCFDCAATCIETINHCLTQGGAHASAGHIGLLQTCADICAVAANTMLRGVHAHMAVCAACADICRQCAEACEAMADNAAMRACADACRRCAESCRAMSGSM